MRAKLSVGKRIKAKIEADILVDKHIEYKKKSTEEHDKKSFEGSWDSAMQTALSDLKSQGVVRKLVL